MTDERTKEIRLRKYRPSDKDECVELIRKTLGKTCEKISELDFSRGVGSRENDYSFYTRIVAIKDKKIIGICGFYRTNYMPTELGGIDWFAVDRKYRHCGLGSLLFRAATKGIQGNIFVWATKRSMKFYKKMGFGFLPSDSPYLMIRGRG